MRHESVSGLIVNESDMILLLLGPDKFNHIDKVSAVAKSKNINMVFKELHYKGAAELFTMWLCLLWPLISKTGSKKRKRHVEDVIAMRSNTRQACQKTYN